MKKTKILIVEDEAVTAMALQENLESNGYEITGVIDRGENVMGSIEKSIPDVVLMDIVLKGKMTGIDAADLVTKQYDLPIVYLTANSDETTFKKSKVTHPYGFILKPFNERELKINIEIALHKKQLEYALEKSYREMESNVEYRTAELTIANQQLEHEAAIRRKTEKELVETQQKWESLVKNTNEMVIIIDKEDKIVYISDVPESVKQTGITADKMVGNSLYSFIRKEYHTEIEVILDKVIVNKETSTLQVEGVATGNFYDSTIMPWYKNEKIDGAICLFTDVTEKLLRQKELKTKEERYRHFVSRSHEGIWRMEFVQPLSIKTSIKKLTHHILYDGSIEECNKVMANMYGFERAEDMHGKRLIDLFGAVTDEEIAIATERINKFVKNNFSVENTISAEKDSDGNAIFISNSTAGNIENGKLVRLWGIQRDVTESVRSQRALEESEQNLSKAQRIAQIGNWHWKMNDDELFWSDETFRLHGYKPNEIDISYEQYLSHIHEDDFDNVKKTIQKTLKEYNNYHIQYRIITKNGEKKFIEAQGEVIVDEHKNAVGMRGVCQDITKRKESEIALGKAKDELELRVKDRTKDLQLSNNQLRAVTKKVTQAIKVKDEFLSIMSHEIRTPLNSIIGLTDLLVSKNKQSDQHDIINTLQISGSHLKGLIDDILDYSKIQANKLEIENSKFDILQLLNDVCKVYLSFAKGKRLNFQTSINGKLPRYLKGDKIRLAQILNNLIDNAIKFTSSGDIVFTTNFIGQNKGNVNVEFSVKDSGIGISKKKQKIVFEPFTQADLTISRNYGGTGLGLTIVNKLVSMLHGTIELISEPNQGTEFIVNLPFKNVDNSSIIESNTDLLRNRKFNNVKILYAEDVVSNQFLVQNLLSVMGIHCDIANDGIIAVEKAFENNYDMILMDIQMPGLNGFEACKKIREQGANRQTPIIAFTADISKQTRKDIVKSGMNDVILKPIDTPKFIRLFDTYIED